MLYRVLPIHVILLFFSLYSHCFATYQPTLGQDDSYQLCQCDLESGLPEAPVTTQEVRNFLSQHGAMSTQILFAGYSESAMTEVRLFLKSKDCIPEIEIRKILFKKLQSTPQVMIVTAGLLTGVLAWNYANSLLPYYMPESLYFIEPTIPALVFIGSTVLLTPITLPITSSLQRMIFACYSDQTSNVDMGNDAQMQSQWLDTQMTYGMNGQMGRNTTIEAYQLLINQIGLISIQMPSLPESQKDFILNRIALVMKTHSKFFKDVKPSSEIFTVNIPEFLSIHEKHFAAHEFKEALLAAIEAIDGSTFDSTYFDRMIDAWIPRRLIRREALPGDVGSESGVLPTLYSPLLQDD